MSSLRRSTRSSATGRPQSEPDEIPLKKSSASSSVKTSKKKTAEAKVSTSKKSQSQETPNVGEASEKDSTSEPNKSPEIIAPIRKTPAKKTKMSELQKAIESLKRSDARCQKLVISDLKDFEKNLKKTFEKTKRDAQMFEQERGAAKPSRNRSGIKRGAQKIINQQKTVYSEGKWILKGMDDARETFDMDELDYLEKSIAKIRVVGELKLEHLKYLVVYKFLDQLKAIRRGEIESEFHQGWEQLKGKCQHDLQSEIKTTLFTNEQRDYISGMLQELFDANKKDDNGDIRHGEINYVALVMLAEATIRIVKHIHNFSSIQDAKEYMKKSSREAHGISSDEE